MPPKRKRSAVKDDEVEASRPISSSIADEAIALLQQRKEDHGPAEFHKSLQLLKKFLDEQLEKGHIAIYSSRFMDRFHSEHAGKLSNPKLAQLVRNVECESYKMEHMDAELSTEKRINFSWESDTVCITFQLYLEFNGFTDGTGPHASALHVTILDKQSNGKGMVSSSIELDDYEDYEDLYTSNLRKNDIRQIDKFWRNLPQLSKILSSEPFSDENEDEDNASTDQASPYDHAKEHLLDFLQHVIRAMKNTHPFDEDD